MDSIPPHTPRIRPVPLPTLPSAPERHYIDGQLTPLTPHPNLLAQAQQIHEILQPKRSSDVDTATSDSTNVVEGPSSGGEDEGLSPLYYDFKDPPSEIIIGNTASTAGTSLRLLKTIPATRIPLRRLRILLPTTTPISVIVSNSPFVSVLDILDAVYSTLHAPISPSVGDDLDLPNTIYNPRSTVDLSETTDSPGFPSSSTQSPDTLHLPFRGNSYQYHPTEKLISVNGDSNSGRKIDYLKGRTTFAGLTRCTVAEEFGPITWKLHTT